MRSLTAPPFRHLAPLFLLLPALSAAAGLMLNDDGDFSFTAPDGHHKRDVRVSVDALVGTPVATLMYSVGAGSDILYYPTTVASIWGWQDSDYAEKLASPENPYHDWWARIAKIVHGQESGLDPIRAAGEQAAKRGIAFVPSYRMNDDHFIFDPVDYPLTGQFWLENRDRLIIGETPIDGHPPYGQLFDFAHEEVRAYRRDVIFEVIDRYGDISHGIELDFNRVQIFFKPGMAAEGAPLMTELVREVRGKLREAAELHGRMMKLYVRVPPALENCEWSGLEVERWMQEGLVDVVIPAQLMTLAWDMPIADFVAAAGGTNVQIVPAIYPRYGVYTWPVDTTPSAESYHGRARRQVSPEMVRGAAANYWRAGASGFQLFNFHHEDGGLRPFSDRVYRIMRDLADPSTLAAADKVFAVTPGYYLDHLGTYQYRKQVPAQIHTGETVVVTLEVADELTGSSSTPPPRRIILRLGLLGNHFPDRFRVVLNGTDVSVDLDQIPTGPGSPGNASKLYLQGDIAGGVVRQGRNEVAIAFDSEPRGEVVLNEVWISVIYDRKYLDLLDEPLHPGSQ